MRWSGSPPPPYTAAPGGAVSTLRSRHSQPCVRRAQMCWTLGLFSGHSPALIAMCWRLYPDLPVPSFWVTQGWQLWVVSSDPSDAR